MSSNGKNLKWVGTRPVRPDGVDKVTGRARFGADFALPNMLVGKVLRSPHAHARIRSIDTAKAEALPGVKGGADERRPSPPSLGVRACRRGDGQLPGHVPERPSRTRRRFTTGTRSRRSPPSTRAPRTGPSISSRWTTRCCPTSSTPSRRWSRTPRSCMTTSSPTGSTRSGQALQRRQAGRGRTGRRRGRFRGSRHRGRARVRHQGGPPGLHRTPFVRGKRIGGRPGGAVVHHPGAVHRPRLLREAARHGHLEDPGDSVRDRRRLRRQDGGVPRAARARPLPQGMPAGQDDHEPHGGLPGHRGPPRAATCG